MVVYRMLADAVAVLHFAYVGFVVVGLLMILMGIVLKWQWIRNRWFRIVHLTMIGIVAVEAVLNITCPLTTLEKYWRAKAGDAVYAGSFIGDLVDSILFIDAPEWIIRVGHLVFAMIVFSTLWLAPPIFSKRPTAN